MPSGFGWLDAFWGAVVFYCFGWCQWCAKPICWKPYLCWRLDVDCGQSDLLSRQSSPSKDTEVQFGRSLQVETTEGPLRLGTGTMLQDDGGAGRRIIKINGEFSSQSVLAEHLAVSWLTPDMDGVLAAAASERRQFLDRLVIAFDPAHSGRIQRYEKAYRQRNRLLEEGQQDQSWYEALEQQMAESGMAIIAARQAMVDALDVEHHAIAVIPFNAAQVRW